MSTTPETRTIYRLARMAGCADPDSGDSLGATFLRSVETTTNEAIEYGEHTDGSDLSDVVHGIADSCVPVYNIDIWQTFTDLVAWDIDLDDIGGSSGDMTMDATASLYLIGQTLAEEILTEAINAEADNETNNDEDDQ